MQLRNYQEAALRKSKEKFAQGITRQLIALPTGTGKTPLFACVRSYFDFQKRVMVLVHREELAQQAADKLRVWNPGEHVGVEMADSYSSPNDRFVVASVQTIGRAGSSRLSKFRPDEFDAIIVDEAHHSVASTYKNIFNHFQILAEDNKKLLLGVTATPNRGDGAALGEIYDEIIYQMSVLDAIRQGWLVDIHGLRVKTNSSLDGVHTVAGDFATGELSKEVNTAQRNELIVRKWMENANERSTIAFTVDIAHAQALASAFKHYGVSAEAVWGEDPYRADKLKAHRDGTLRVLCNCAVLTEGYDDPNVGCIVMARPTKSNLLFVQMAGRGTRLPQGYNNISDVPPAAKKDCLLMDVVDNTSHHSLVTLPSIFGLSNNLDLKKQSVMFAVDAVNKAKKEHPEVDLSTLEEISKIPALVEKVNLFEVKFPPQVMNHSQLQWHQNSAGDSYVLLLPNDESVTITQDLLGDFHVVGQVNRNKFTDRVGKDLPTAFHRADELVQMFGRNMLHLVKRESSWHGDAATQSQIGLLKRLRIPVPVSGSLTKGQAAKLITAHFAKHGRPNYTPRKVVKEHATSR